MLAMMMIWILFVSNDDEDDDDEDEHEHEYDDAVEVDNLDSRKEDLEVACKGPQECQQTCWDLVWFGNSWVRDTMMKCIAWKHSDHLKASWFFQHWGIGFWLCMLSMLETLFVDLSLQDSSDGVCNEVW